MLKLYTSAGIIEYPADVAPEIHEKIQLATGVGARAAIIVDRYGKEHTIFVGNIVAMEYHEGE